MSWFFNSRLNSQIAKRDKMEIERIIRDGVASELAEMRLFFPQRQEMKNLINECLEEKAIQFRKERGEWIEANNGGSEQH